MGQNSPKEDVKGSLYARGPLCRQRSEMFIGARLLSAAGHPSSVRAYGPATFPVGEGDLWRGVRSPIPIYENLPKIIVGAAQLFSIL